MLFYLLLLFLPTENVMINAIVSSSLIDYGHYEVDRLEKFIEMH